ncbi:hypothetical protein HMPREF9428_02474 [Citrobacter portucalensis]|nr:hypothetical protein HMPREF9428_02474 [Citrobacter portucalensis]
MALHSTRWLALGYFTYFFSYGIFLPFWSVWLEGLGLTPETIGLLLGAGLIARFLGSLLIAPRVSDPSRLISALRILALLTLVFALAFWAGTNVAWLMVVMIGLTFFLTAGTADRRAGQHLAETNHHGLRSGATMGIGSLCDRLRADRQTGEPV